MKRAAVFYPGDPADGETSGSSARVCRDFSKIFDFVQLGMTDRASRRRAARHAHRGVTRFEPAEFQNAGHFRRGV